MSRRECHWPEFGGPLRADGAAAAAPLAQAPAPAPECRRWWVVSYRTADGLEGSEPHMSRMGAECAVEDLLRRCCRPVRLVACELVLDSR